MYVTRRSIAYDTIASGDSSTCAIICQTVIIIIGLRGSESHAKSLRPNTALLEFRSTQPANPLSPAPWHEDSLPISRKRCRIQCGALWKTWYT